MSDPTLLALVRHSASLPPAVIDQITDSELFLSAYEAIAADQDRALDNWLAGEAEVRRRTRQAIEARPQDFTPEMLDDIIEPLKRHMRRQKRITSRLERRADRGGVSPRLMSLRQRVLGRQQQQYEAGADLVCFLEEMRARIIQSRAAGALERDWIPNETTLAAIAEARQDGLPKFASVADLMADLHAGD